MSTLTDRDPGELAAEIVATHEDEAAWLDEFTAQLERLRAGTTLERVLDVWGLSYTEAGRMFGVSRQALQKWLRQGVPSSRAAQVADAARATDLLTRHLKRERIPAVVQRPAAALDGLSLIERFRTAGSHAVLEATRAMFAFGDAHA